MTMSKKAFHAIDCKHFCVFDYRVMVNESTGLEEAYFLEAISVAAFSPASIVVSMANKSKETGGPDLAHPRLF